MSVRNNTIIAWRSRRFATLIFCGVLMFSVPGAALAESAEARAEMTDEKPVMFSESVDSGLLFVRGEYIPGPYQIAASAEAVSVNGIILSEVPQEVPVRDSAAEREDRKHNAAAGGRVRSGARRTPSRLARSVSETLQNDGFVLTFSDTPIIRIDAGGEQYAFCESILNGLMESTDEGLLEALPNEQARVRVTQWINEFRPSPELQSELQNRIDIVDALSKGDEQRAAALVRLDTFAYPLTLVAMLLGVIALGHMLKWTARSIVADQGNVISAESVRGAELALLLMAGMSAVDLLWTILASQAGIMKEVNPLAVGIVHSPQALAAFKVIATSLGFALLYALRKQKRGQEVTWWMCLVCVLVTFRWVIFDSMNA